MHAIRYILVAMALFFGLLLWTLKIKLVVLATITFLILGASLFVVLVWHMSKESSKAMERVVMAHDARTGAFLGQGQLEPIRK